MPTQPPRLYYIHDPMCSWCWGFRNTWLAIRQQLPESVQLTTLVGGLAPDSAEPMPDSMQQYLQSAWKKIQQTIPGTKFNFDFWTQNTPRRSTYPACRAVVAAKKLAQKEQEMTFGIQQAYYLQAKNPSDLDTLIGVASEIGLDPQAFTDLMNSSEIHDLFEDELQQCRDLGINSFPSLALQIEGQLHGIAIDYNSADATLSQIKSLVEHHAA